MSRREVSDSTAEPLGVTLGFSQQDSVSHRRVFIPEAFNESFILSSLWLNDCYGFRLQITIIKKKYFVRFVRFLLFCQTIKTEHMQSGEK